jgi:hypothetical protein
MTVEDMPEIDKVLRLLTEDPRYAVDMSVVDELQDAVMDGRRWREVTAAQYKSRQDLQVIAKRLDQAQFLRSRVREIKFAHMWALSAVERLWDACCAVLYRKDEYRKITPAAVREATVNAVLPTIRERLDDVKMICKMADEADALLNGAYFTMRELVRINTAHLDAETKE